MGRLAQRSRVSTVTRLINVCVTWLGCLPVRSEPHLIAALELQLGARLGGRRDLER